MPEAKGDIKFRPLDTGVDLAPDHLTKEAFGQRLTNLMMEKGWNSGDLLKFGIPRDATSKYMRGKILPSPLNLKKIAEAFGLSPLDLLPNSVMKTKAQQSASFEMRVTHDDPGTTHMKIDRLVPTTIAIEIARLLNDAESTHRSRGREAPKMRTR